MILVTVGSQKFQFNRLLKEIDDLIEQNILTEEVFAQIGASTYFPKYYQYKDFVSQEKFKEYIENADIVITHGGTGSIVSALKSQKKVIAIPRLSEFGEHVDDHQIQIIKEFEKLNLLEPLYDVNDLKIKLEVVKKKKYEHYISNTKEIIQSIEQFIEGK